MTLTIVTALFVLIATSAAAYGADRINPKREAVVHRFDRGLAGTPAAKQAWQYRYQVWMPKHWQNLAACESGSNPPNWKHDSGTYVGAFGFYIGSWQQYRYAGYPARASQATPWQQWRVALRIAARFGIASPWGCWRGPQHAWVRNGLPEYGTRR